MISSPLPPSLADRATDPILDLEGKLRAVGYLAPRSATVGLWLAQTLQRPLLLEGPAGVGKTDLAQAAAKALGYPLVRLQCYEGLDESRALFAWDYAKQILFTQLLRDVLAPKFSGGMTLSEAAELVGAEADVFYHERFLRPRPILQALRSPTRSLLLLDEIDRAEPEFEAFLLEVLAEYQVTIPELGTVRATHPPLVVLTSNGSRELTDALRRRCLYVSLTYPEPSREIEIVCLRVPGIEQALATSLVAFVETLRTLDLRKVPSISETVDWARALLAFGARHLSRELVETTFSALLKFEEDQARTKDHVEAWFAAPERGRNS